MGPYPADPVLQRLPRPTETLSESTRWIVHPAGMLVLAPPRHVALMDVADGKWLWRRDAEQGVWQSEIGWNANWLAVHPLGQGRVEIWNVLTGHTLRREHSATAPWKIAPLFFGGNDDFVTLREDDRLVGVSTVPTLLGVCRGAVERDRVALGLCTRGGLPRGDRGTTGDPHATGIRLAPLVDSDCRSTAP